jgi:hypothetical protein
MDDLRFVPEPEPPGPWKPLFEQWSSENIQRLIYPCPGLAFAAGFAAGREYALKAVFDRVPGAGPPEEPGDQAVEV